MLVMTSKQDFMNSLYHIADAGPHRHREYLTLIAYAYLFFLALYLLFGIFILPLTNPTFNRLPRPFLISRERTDYQARVIAIIHATLVTILAFIGMYSYCDESFFTSHECRHHPRVYHVLASIVTVGYLLQDLIVIALFRHATSAIQLQTYAHHVAAIAGFYTALVLRPQGSPFLLAAIANQFTEISTPFMNIRQLMFYHKLSESKFARINNIVFGFVFLVFRLVFQIIFFSLFLPWLFSEMMTNVHQNYTGAEMAGFYFCFMAQLLGLGLNLHWMSLIIKGARKLKKGKDEGKKE